MRSVGSHSTSGREKEENEERTLEVELNCTSDNRCYLTFDNLRKLVIVYCNNAEFGKISYECTFVGRNKCVLYCHAVKLTEKIMSLYVIFVSFLLVLSHFREFLLIF